MNDFVNGNEDVGTGRGAPSTERRRDPGLLKMLGVSEEELNDPGAALLSAGVQKMWAVMEAMKLPFMEEEDPTPGSSPFHGEGRTAGAAGAAGRVKEAEFARECGSPRGQECPRHPTPIWQSISGLYPDAVHSPEGRERRLRTLMDVVLKLLRHEMEAERATPNVYHTVYWDPLLKVCSQLGISRAHLSRLAKESTGLAAHELGDGIRAEKVKEMMKISIRRFVAAMRGIKKEGDALPSPRIRSAHLGPLPGGEGTAGAADAATAEATELRVPSTAEVWAALREARRGPHFHRGAWALSFGFVNYNRLYRACLFYFKLAPSQVEFAAIEEVLEEMKEGKIGGMGEEANSETENLGAVLAGIKERHVQFFTELSAVVWREAAEGARRRSSAMAG